MQTIPISGIFDEFSHINYYNLPNGLIANYSLSGTNISRFSINLPAQYNSNTVFGYMENFEIHYRRSLASVEDNTLRFVTVDSNSTLEYRLSGFGNNDVKFFDITSHPDVSIINPISSSGGNANIQVSITSGEPKEFIAIQANQKNLLLSVETLSKLLFLFPAKLQIKI